MPTQSADPLPAGWGGLGSAPHAGRARVGAPPRQQTPEPAGANGGDAEIAGASTSRAGARSPRHRGLGAAPAPPNPTNHLPVAGPRDGSFCGGSWEDDEGSGAPQGTEHPGARASLFSQGRALPPASPQIRASAAAPPRVPGWPRQSQKSRWVPVALPANTEGRKHLAEPSPVRTRRCGEEVQQRPVSLLSLLRLPTGESPELRPLRRCRPRPPLSPAPSATFRRGSALSSFRVGEG